jgi:hypothetical protein
MIEGILNTRSVRSEFSGNGLLSSQWVSEEEWHTPIKHWNVRTQWSLSDYQERCLWTSHPQNQTNTLCFSPSNQSLFCFEVWSWMFLTSEFTVETEHNKHAPRKTRMCWWCSTMCEMINKESRDRIWFLNTPKWTYNQSINHNRSVEESRARIMFTMIIKTAQSHSISQKDKHQC